MPRVLLSVYTACFGAVIIKVTSMSNDQMINHLGATSASTVENSKGVHDMVLAALSPYKYYWTTSLKHYDGIFEQLNVQWVVLWSLEKRKLIMAGCCYKIFHEIVGNGTRFSVLRRLKFPHLSQEHYFISYDIALPCPGW